MGDKWITLTQHNRIVAELTAERDKAIRERIMAERNNDILDRIREAKRGPLESYVGHVLDDAAAEIEALRNENSELWCRLTRKSMDVPDYD